MARLVSHLVTTHIFDETALNTNVKVVVMRTCSEEPWGRILSVDDDTMTLHRILPGTPAAHCEALRGCVGKVLFRVNGIAAMFANDLDRLGHGNSVTLQFSAPQGEENGVVVEPGCRTACMANAHTSVSNIAPAEQGTGLKDEQQNPSVCVCYR